MNKLEAKIKELKQRAAPINYSNVSIDSKGELVEENIIKGYAIVWNVRDMHGTKMLKGCCAKSIRERGPDSNAKYKITMLWQHDQKDPIGQFRVLREDDYGLYFEAVIDEQEVNGARALRQIKTGTVNQFSDGFDFVWDKMSYDDTDDSLVCAEIDLYEISPVTIGSNNQTYAIRSKEALEHLHDDTEDFIMGLPRAKQLEARQIFTRHKTLLNIEPDEQRKKTLSELKPDEAGQIDYNYLLKNFKI